MNRRFGLICFSLLLLMPSVSWGQFICPPGRDCSCGNEKVSPNLIVIRPALFRGQLLDPTGAPIAFVRAIVQVRNPNSGTVLASAVVDNAGKFDLGNLQTGSYRFLAVWQHDGKVTRLPLLDQPKQITCSSKECDVKVILQVHATDQEFEFCPPK